MTPKQSYQALLAEGFTPDARQAAAAEALQSVHDALLADTRAPSTGWLSKLRQAVAEVRRPPVQGLYLWGGVGRGKTMLMNVFHESLPFDDKMREHFHTFMQRIHKELATLKHTVDPLKVVAERLAEQCRVICLDEFHVSDIADAMLLGRLLEALFERRLTVVTTSNIPPGDLYKTGLQRARFLPAIAAIKAHLRVFELDSNVDYRLRVLEQAEIYHTPLDDQADASLRRCFEAFAPQNVIESNQIEVLGRHVSSVRTADGIAWFEFVELCDSPRAAADYIEIARSFHTVLLANVPCFESRDHDDKAVRFIALVDEFYDRNVNLILSAAAPPSALYIDGRLASPFERTESRLIEMQSHEYLARLHVH